LGGGGGAQQCERARPSRIVTAALTLAALAGAGCQLPNADKAAKEESILAIVMSGVPSPEEANRMANDATNPDRRARGLTLLMNAPFGGEPVYVDLYERRAAPADPIAGIESEHPAVRAVAARALALHGDPGHVDLILPLLEHESPQVRLQAAHALQRLHNPAAVAPLLQHIRYENAQGVVQEPEPHIRAAAADALGQYAERSVILGLMTALDDDSLAVTSRALKSLQTLTGQDLPDDRRAWLQWFENTTDHFAGRTPYVYPVFERDFRWTDIIPFTRPARNEIPANPIGAQAG
jgi:hypothetical protein